VPRDRAPVKAIARSKAPWPVSVRERALAGLPEEFGYSKVDLFLRAFRAAAKQFQTRSHRNRVVRPGGTQLIRRRVAKLLIRGRSAIEIALELGFSLRLIDRVLRRLKNPQKLMNKKKLKALATAKARVAQLEKSIAADLGRELANLPAQFGFETTAAFVSAVKAAALRRQGLPPVKRTRTKITAAIRKQIKVLVKARKSGAEIARKLGISTSSVQIAKRAMHLTRKP
jgi:DNA-binding CsgD family transcriptional regulator